MRIATQFGSDTGMAIVDVFLETEQECRLDEKDIWEELRPLLQAKGISPGSVVDFFLYKQDAAGNWVSAGLLSW